MQPKQPDPYTSGADANSGARDPYCRVRASAISSIPIRKGRISPPSRTGPERREPATRPVLAGSQHRHARSLWRGRAHHQPRLPLRPSSGAQDRRNPYFKAHDRFFVFPPRPPRRGGPPPRGIAVRQPGAGTAGFPGRADPAPVPSSAATAAAPPPAAARLARRDDDPCATVWFRDGAKVQMEADGAMPMSRHTVQQRPQVSGDTCTTQLQIHSKTAWRP